MRDFSHMKMTISLATTKADARAALEKERKSAYLCASLFPSPFSLASVSLSLGMCVLRLF